jgi:hypothetical protein
MSGLKDHDCKARMEARQGREGVTRQQNNQTTVYSLLQSIGGRTWTYSERQFRCGGP